GVLRAARRVGLRAALRLFIVGATMTAAAATMAGRGKLAPLLPILLTGGAVAALVAWTGLLRLVAFETRRRDVPTRALFLGFAVIGIAAQWRAGEIASLGVLGV